MHKKMSEENVVAFQCILSVSSLECSRHHGTNDTKRKIFVLNVEILCHLNNKINEFYKSHYLQNIYFLIFNL